MVSVNTNIVSTISLFMLLLLVITGCSEPDQKNDQKNDQTTFEELDKTLSGISFRNTLIETDSLNYFTYPYIYMGGGVSIGDINNDGLKDIYFTGNMVDNQLYLNKGNLKFEDITPSAQVGGDDRWYTGTTMVDINHDGYLDIYASVSGMGKQRKNQLFVNNHDNTFTEKAEEYGIADAGNSIQSVFFDYDNDGDLDLYVTNYPLTSFRTQNFRYKYLMNNVTEENSDRLYENTGQGHFIDITKKSGLLSFGLSISTAIADFNADGWQDIYVSNDFSTPDYFFINNGDGSFTDHLKDITRQTAFYGMGTDAADINNDGLIDLFQVDMSAEDNRRAKANMASMNPALFWSTVNAGFHYQYMYNTLQLNNGIVDGLPAMSNVASLSGVTSTDWSWSPLFADFDNDGWKDLFVSNGTRREINNKDFFKKIEKELSSYNNQQLLDAVNKIPSEPLPNYIFKNADGLMFEKANEDWGMSSKSFSNGCAYADLDNDGDLELVINNIDSAVSVYKNHTVEKGENNFLRVKLSGDSKNEHGIGSEVIIYTNGSKQVQQLMLSRGFQSSVAPYLHFGLGNNESVDSITVKWPGGNCTKLSEVLANQVVEIVKENNNSDCTLDLVPNAKTTPLFKPYDQATDTAYIHEENYFDDYAFQVLLPHKLSNLGPGLAVGDVNGDGLDDYYIGGAAGKSAGLFIQEQSGTFTPQPVGDEKDASYEDVAASFFDVDNDGDLDLYVVSGGNEFASDDTGYQDRLYVNSGGVFTKSLASLSNISGSGSCVKPFDFDSDGDLDLFIGGRHDPRNYPYPGRSYLLVNKFEQGNLSFDDKTDELAPGLSDIGMVTDATWIDYNDDGTKDLVVVGEWMPIVGFAFKDNAFAEPENLIQGKNSYGWWFSIEKGDMDNDGDEDLIVGNLGLNYKYKATDSTSFDVYVYDFDNNKKDDIILSYYNFGQQYPVRGRECSSQQIPTIKTAYKDYNSFSTATMEDIFGTDRLDKSLHYSVSSFASIYLENQGGGQFTDNSLPTMTQIAPINDILIEDVNDDNILDMIIAGNLYASEVETPRADAGTGLVLLGDGKGLFTPMSIVESGLLLNYDTRSLAFLRVGESKAMIAVNNQGPILLYELNDNKSKALLSKNQDSKTLQ